MGMEQYDEVRSKVAAIQQRLDNSLYEIRTTRAYSAAGQKSEMAKAVLAAKKETEALRERFDTARNLRQTSLKIRLFGKSDTESASDYRDAKDRADKLETSDAAMAMLRSAHESADDSLARAAARRALERGWSDAVDMYREQTGSITGGLIDELNGITTGPNATAAEAAIFRIRSPKELHGLDSDVMLASYADSGSAQ